MFKKFIFPALSLVILLACNKPIANPELSDPIYLDILKRLSDAEKELQENKTMLKDREFEFKNIKPQTGQSQFMQKKLSEAHKKVERFDQIVTYLKIHSNSRKEYARRQYIEAWNNKKPWPNMAEYEDYKQVVKMQTIRKQWSVQERQDELGVTKLREEMIKRASPEIRSPADEHSAGGH